MWTSQGKGQISCRRIYVDIDCILEQASQLGFDLLKGKSSTCKLLNLNLWKHHYRRQFSLFLSLGEGASPNECDQTYRGKKAFSEKETKSVSKYLEGLNKQGRLKGFIDFHAFSQMWFIPWGYTATKTNDHEEQVSEQYQ